MHLLFQNWALTVFQTHYKLCTCFISFNSRYKLMRFIVLLLPFNMRKSRFKKIRNVPKSCSYQVIQPEFEPQQFIPEPTLYNNTWMSSLLKPIHLPHSLQKASTQTYFGSLKWLNTWSCFEIHVPNIQKQCQFLKSLILINFSEEIFLCQVLLIRFSNVLKAFSCLSGKLLKREY